MSEQVERAVAYEASEAEVPAKCAQCPYLDTEHDPFSGVNRLYCRAPWWTAKRWFCALPTGVIRA